MQSELASVFLKIALAVAGLVVVLHLVSEQGVDRALNSADPVWLLGAVLCSVLSGVAMGLRLVQVLRVWGIPMAWVEGLVIHYQSMFYMFFMPMGMEVARFAKIRGRVPDMKKRVIVAAIFSDRVIGLLLFILLSLVLMPVVDFSGHLQAQGALEGVGLLWWAVGAGAVLVLVAGGFWALRHVQRERMENLGETLRMVSEAFLSRARVLPMALLWSLVATLFYILAVHLAGRSLGLAPGFWVVFFVSAAGVLFQALPISVVGVTATEAVGVVLYMIMGLGRGEALLMVTLTYGVRLVQALLGASIELAHGGGRLVRIGQDVGTRKP
ncbi:MAG: flippase-like domain-containing protein [Magnetococcus sp. WYHC-3]